MATESSIDEKQTRGGFLEEDRIKGDFWLLRCIGAATILKFYYSVQRYQGQA